MEQHSPHLLALGRGVKVNWTVLRIDIQRGDLCSQAAFPANGGRHRRWLAEDPVDRQLDASFCSAMNDDIVTRRRALVRRSSVSRWITMSARASGYRVLARSTALRPLRPARSGTSPVEVAGDSVGIAGRTGDIAVRSGTRPQQYACRPSHVRRGVLDSRRALGSPRRSGTGVRASRGEP